MNQLSIYSSVDNLNYIHRATVTATSAIGAACPVPLDVFYLDFTGRYIKLVIDSYHDLGGGWHFLNMDYEDGMKILVEVG